MIIGLVRAALLLDRPDWLETARQSYRFINESMVRDGLLGHSWRDGHLLVPGFATDHAAMMLAALTLHEATGEALYLGDAKRWKTALTDHYADESGLLFLVADQNNDLVIRPQPTSDEATPNANGLYAEALVRLAALDSAGTTDETISVLAGRAKLAPLNHASILNAMDLYLNGLTVVVAGSRKRVLLDKARSVPYPNRIVVDLDDARDLPAEHPARVRIAEAGQAAAFICRGQTCSLPISDPAALHQALQASLRGAA